MSLTFLNKAISCSVLLWKIIPVRFFQIIKSIEIQMMLKVRRIFLESPPSSEVIIRTFNHIPLGRMKLPNLPNCHSNVKEY